VNDYGIEVVDWDLRGAEAISGDGRTIVGQGVVPDYEWRAWILRLPPECSDGLDNDGDGHIDAGDDVDCRHPRFPREDADGCGEGFRFAAIVPPVLWLRRRLSRKRDGTSGSGPDLSLPRA